MKLYVNLTFTSRVLQSQCIADAIKVIFILFLYRVPIPLSRNLCGLYNEVNKPFLLLSASK